MSVFDLNYAKCVIQSEGQTICSMTDVVDSPAFLQATTMLYECQSSCIVSGIGKAGIIGQKISATLASTGTPSHFLHPAEAVHGDLGRLRHDDIVLVLSYGGETDEIIRLINLVKQLDIRLISITSDADSTLSRHSDVVLLMGKVIEACPLGVAPSVSTACMLALGDALSFTVMKARHFKREDYVRFHPGGSLGAQLMTVEQSMMFTADENLPIAHIHNTLQQMLEKTKGIKRHGAVMVVNDSDQLAGIITDADLRRLLADHGSNVLYKPLSDVMTPDCKRIHLNALASEATALFHQYRIDELPVVDENERPVGLIDVQDIIAIKVVG